MASTAGAISHPGNPAAALQPLLRLPIGDLGLVRAVAPVTTVPEGMTPATLLMSDVLPFAALQAQTSPGVVVVGTSRWAEGSGVTAAEIRAGFHGFYEGARIVFVDDHHVAIGLEEPREVAPHGASSALKGFAAATPIRLVTAYFNSGDFFVHGTDYAALKSALRYGCPGAQVRVVIPGSAILRMESAWSSFPLVALTYARHDFFVIPPGASMNIVSVFLGTIDPMAWLYNQLLEQLVPSEMPGRQLAAVEAMDLLHDPRFREYARGIVANYELAADVRIAALAAIAHYRNPADLQFLLDRMGHERHEKVAAAAATALGELGDPRAIPRLEAVKAGDESPIARGAASAAWTRLNQQQPGEDDRTNVYTPEMSAGWTHLDALETVASNSADPRARARQALALDVWSGAR